MWTKSSTEQPNVFYFDQADSKYQVEFRLCAPSTVWPDVWIKSGPIFSKVGQNVETIVFTSKNDVWRRPQKSLNILATYARDFVAKKYQVEFNSMK